MKHNKKNCRSYHMTFGGLCLNCGAKSSPDEPEPLPRVMTDDIPWVSAKMQETQDLHIDSNAKNSYLCDVWLNGELFSRYRLNRVMAFCEGWLTRHRHALTEPPVYRGITVTTGVLLVLGPLTELQRQYAGSPKRSYWRGWQALLEHHTQENLLFFYKPETRKDLDEWLKFQPALIAAITATLCNNWDYRNIEKESQEK